METLLKSKLVSSKNISEWKKKIEAFHEKIGEAANFAKQEAEKAGFRQLINVNGVDDELSNPNFSQVRSKKCAYLLIRLSVLSENVVNVLRNNCQVIIAHFPESRSTLLEEIETSNNIPLGWSIIGSWACVRKMIGTLAVYIKEDDLHRIKAKDFSESNSLQIEKNQENYNVDPQVLIKWVCKTLNEHGMSGLLSNYHQRPLPAAKKEPSFMEADEAAVLHLCRALSGLLKAETMHALRWCVPPLVHLYWKEAAAISSAAGEYAEDLNLCTADKRQTSPSANSKKAIYVSGAGSKGVNGTYRFEGTKNDAEHYVGIDNSMEIFRCRIPALAGMPVDTRWFIGSASVKKVFYSCHSAASTPPTTDEEGTVICPSEAGLMSELDEGTSPNDQAHSIFGIEFGCPQWMAVSGAGGSGGKLPTPHLETIYISVKDQEPCEEKGQAELQQHGSDEKWDRGYPVVESLCDQNNGEKEGQVKGSQEAQHQPQRHCRKADSKRRKGSHTKVRDIPAFVGKSSTTMDLSAQSKVLGEDKSLLSQAMVPWSLKENEIYNGSRQSIEDTPEHMKIIIKNSLKDFWKKRLKLQLELEKEGRQLFQTFTEEPDTTVERLQSEMPEELKASVPEPPPLSSLSLNVMVKQILQAQKSARNRQEKQRKRASSPVGLLDLGSKNKHSHEIKEEDEESLATSRQHNAIVSLETLCAQLVEEQIDSAETATHDIQYFFQVTFAEWEENDDEKKHEAKTSQSQSINADDEQNPVHTVGLIHRSHIIGKKLTSLMALQGYLSEVFREGSALRHGTLPTFPDPYYIGQLHERIKEKQSGKLSFDSSSGLLKTAMAKIKPYLEEVFLLMKSLSPNGDAIHEVQAYQALRAFLVSTDQVQQHAGVENTEYTGGLRVGMLLARSDKKLPVFKDDLQLKLQGERCMGCGTDLARKTLNLNKNYAPCRHIGALFCKKLCHNEEYRSIPSRIVHQWDFEGHRVCRSAARFIDAVHRLPLICMSAQNPALFESIQELRAVQFLRMQLCHLRNAVHDSQCHLGSTIMASHLGHRAHLAIETELYSMEDLEEVRSGSLGDTLSEVVELLSNHVQSGCVDCQRTGTLCGVCHNRTPIFAYQIWVVAKCNLCKALFHKGCIRTQGKHGMCPRCNEASSGGKGF